QGLSPRDDGGVGPYWDGEDRWTIVSGMLLHPDAGADDAGSAVDHPAYSDPGAYVTGHVLVAHLETTLYPGGVVPGATVLEEADQFTLAGTLYPIGDRWGLRDAVTGLRAGAMMLLTTWAYLPNDAGVP